MPDMPVTSARPLTAPAAAGLRRLNLIVGSAHAVQALVLLALAADVSLPVTASFLTGPPGAGGYDSASLGSLRIDWLVAAFLLLAAIDHLTLSTGRPRRWYEANVARGINPARWWEYSGSASLMVGLIAMLAGVSELVALIGLFGANAAMVFFGLVQERVNLDREGDDWRPFLYGCIIGAVPWVAITAQLVISASEGNAVPGFVSRSSSRCCCCSTASPSTCGSNTAAAAAGRSRRSPSASTSSSASSPRARWPGRSTPARSPEADDRRTGER